MTTPAADPALAPLPDAPATAPRSAMFIVFLVVFIDLLGFGIVLPLLPRYSNDYLGVLPPAFEGVALGVLFSIFSLMQFVFSPMWGRISDRIGRRPILLVGLTGSVIFYGLFGIASNIPSWSTLTDASFTELRNEGVPGPVLAKVRELKDKRQSHDELVEDLNRVLTLEEQDRWRKTIVYHAEVPSDLCWLALALLFLSRLGAGVAGASVSTAAAVIADCTTPDKRAKGMALIGVAFGFGFTCGPLIGYLGLTVFDRAHWAPGASASLLSFVALLLAIRLLKETRRPGTAPAGRALFSLSRTLEVLRMPTVGALVTIYFLAIFAFANFEGTLSVLTKSAFDMTDRQNFLIFAYVGAVLMVAQGGFYRRFADKVPEERLLTIGMSLMIVGLAGLGAVAWLAGRETDRAGLETSFFFALAIAVFGFAFVNPSVSALVSRRSDPNRQGEVLGVNQSFASMGRILGPLVGLTLFYLGLSHTLPYLAGVLTLAVVILLLPRIRVR